MTNKEIAGAFRQLGLLMELHGENPFKIRSYQNAYRNLRKLDSSLSDMPDEEIAALKGVGKAIHAKIRELLDSEKMQTLEKYKAKTPEGVQEMLQIKGFGPKKVRVIWQELGVESIGELLYAVNENRLIELKGFGAKTQQDLKEKLLYYQKSRHQFHYAALEADALRLLKQLSEVLPAARCSLTGAVRRRCNTLDGIDLLVGQAGDLTDALTKTGVHQLQQDGKGWKGQSDNGLPVRVQACSPEAFGSALFRSTAADDFLSAFQNRFPGIEHRAFSDEQEIFTEASVPFIAPELREQDWSIELATGNKLPVLIEDKDIRGVLHAHSRYSDGLNSLADMARYVKAQGYEYLGITDHSKSAFYANGLSPARVRQQFDEIELLNKELAPFRIFKGIESDILNDGSLDYDESLVREFDFIIASVHSNLRMNEEKATERLLRAIENPYTSILGHPTGRLLLSRKGYPIDHRRVIDACADHGVAIEINANPYRLDLDWSWIPYALEKGVMIAVNPDAHSLAGVHDIHYGICSARKGGLEAGQCLNSLEVDAFARWCGK